MKHLKLALATLLAFALLPPFSALAQTRGEDDGVQTAIPHTDEPSLLMPSKITSSLAPLAVASNEESAEKPARRTPPRAKTADGLKLAIGVFAFSAGATLETVGIALAWHQCSNESRCEGRCESPLVNTTERKPTARIASKR